MIPTATKDQPGLIRFRRARRQAGTEQLLSRLTGQPAALFCYEQVRDALIARDGKKLGTREIPLAAIVGSVERCADFTRNFRPLKDNTQQRWVTIWDRASQGRPLPPIRTYQVGEAHFVVDGHHRVSVARQSGLQQIAAEVVQVPTRVPLSAHDKPGDLASKASYARFLERTGLDIQHPGLDLSSTTPAHYPLLERQIQDQLASLERQGQRPVHFQEAADHWYSKVYLPVLGVLRERGLVRRFSDKWTEADVYVWACRHARALEDLGLAYVAGILEGYR